MTSDRIPIQRRLRERRYAKGAQTSTEILEFLGITKKERRVLSLDEAESLWVHYLECLQKSSSEALRWPVDESEAVLSRLSSISEVVGSLSVVWFALVDSEPVAVEVPAAPLLRRALPYFVTRAGDLMLVTPDVASGICIELNHLARGDEYEIVAWGAFLLSEP